jgi:hypothetical protein
MEEATRSRSAFAVALDALLRSVEGMYLEGWVLWLNPWYASVGPDGKPTGTRIMPMPPGCGDIFADDPTEEDIQAWKDDLAKNWTPCHKIGEGVTLEQVGRWLNDEEMPSADHLNKILGYFECSAPTPATRAAFARFDEVVHQPLFQVTPFVDQLRRVSVPTSCIASHLFFNRYGIASAMHERPLEEWDEVNAALIAIIKRK